MIPTLVAPKDSQVLVMAVNISIPIPQHMDATHVDKQQK